MEVRPDLHGVEKAKIEGMTPSRCSPSSERDVPRNPPVAIARALPHGEVLAAAASRWLARRRGLPFEPRRASLVNRRGVDHGGPVPNDSAVTYLPHVRKACGVLTPNFCVDPVKVVLSRHETLQQSLRVPLGRT